MTSIFHINIEPIRKILISNMFIKTSLAIELLIQCNSTDKNWNLTYLTTVDLKQQLQSAHARLLASLNRSTTI